MIKRCFFTSNRVLRSFESGNFKQELLKSYLRKTASLFICITDQNFAKTVAAKIADELKNETKIVFEATPGYGVLTEQLLEAGVTRIRVFEHLEDRLPRFQELKSIYGDRLEICNLQILDFINGNYKLLDLNREVLLKECFENVPVQKNWAKSLASIEDSAESSIQFITSLSPSTGKEFLSFLVYSLSRFEYFFSTGPTEFFLFVPLTNYKMMISRPSKNLNQYTAFTIHINSLFDYSEIDIYSPQLKGVEKVKIENKVHTIISSKYFSYTNNRTFKSKDSFVFLKVKPKPFVNELGADFLINYTLFVKQSYIKRSAMAIDYYEKHFPGCGVDLIGLGISYFKTLGDLTSDEMMTIFVHLFKAPQYRNSIFRDL